MSKPYEEGRAACSKYYARNKYRPDSFAWREWERGMQDAMQAETDRRRDEPRDYIREEQGL